MTQTIAKLQLARPRLQIKAQLPAGIQGIQGIQGLQGVQGVAGPTGPGYGGTSTTSLAITNSATSIFATQSGLAYQVGNYVRATSAASSANFMEGAVSAYSGTSLSIAVTNIGGSGTHADWNFGIAGTPGSVGVASIQGNAGAFTLGNGLKNVVNEVDIDPSFLGPACFGGRLTALSATATPNVDVIGSQNLYYAPYGRGKGLPVYSAAGGWALKQFTASSTDQVGLTLALAGSANWAADTIHDVFAVMDSGTLKLATRLWDAGMYSTEAQITNATVITTGTGATAWVRSSAAFDGILLQADAAAARCSASNTGLANFLGQDWGAGVTKVVSRVVITTPTDDFLRGDGATLVNIQVHGSNDNTNWVILDTRNVDASATGATYNFAINQSNWTPYRYHRVGITGNAVNGVNVAEIQFFTIVPPANGRRLTAHDGILVNDASMTARTGAATTITTAQYEGIFLGCIHIDAATAGQITCHSDYGPGRTYGLWNMHNRERITLRAGIRSFVGATTYNLAYPANVDWGPMQSLSTFSAQVLQGYPLAAVNAVCNRPVYIQAAANIAAYECGIGVDSTNSFSGTACSVTHDTTGQNMGHNMVPTVTVPAYAGIKTFYGLEKLSYAQTGVTSLFTDCRNTALKVEFFA